MDKFEQYMKMVILSGESVREIENRSGLYSILKDVACDNSMLWEASHIKQKMVDLLYQSKAMAIDIFGKEFTLGDSINYEAIIESLKTMLEVKEKNSDIPFEQTLLHSKNRYCVLYDLHKCPYVVDMPKNIFRFLVNNNYDSRTIEKLSKPDIVIDYNYIEIIRKTLQIGKDFEKKSRAININTNENNLCALDYVISKLNPIEPYMLYNEYVARYGVDKWDELSKTCAKIDIHQRSLMYRILYEGMDEEKAMNFGIMERREYNIGSRIHVWDTRGIFYKVIREYIKENNKRLY